MRDWPTLVRGHLGPLDLDPARAADVVDELAQHVAQEHADLVSSGVEDSEAFVRAMAPLAGRARLALDIARADRPRPAAPRPPASPWRLSSVWTDARYAVRVLARQPAFTAVVLITLALGIGANAAIFSVVNALVLQPLPYPNGDRLVALGEAGDRVGDPGPSGFTTILDWRMRVHSLDQIAIARDWSAVLMRNGHAERVNGMKVSSNFFTMLGVHPALGREFRAEEDTQNDWRVILLSDHLWRTRFDADPAIAGKAIAMNGRQYTAIGVMPASLEPLISEKYFQPAEMWTLLGYDLTLPYACRSCQHLRALGLLRPGATPAEAQVELQSVQDALQHEHPSDYSTARMAVWPFTQVLTGELRPVLVALSAAVLCVLLIACANVANILLARVSRREQDLAVRMALGAGRARIIQQVLVESLVLGLAGAAAALAIATWTVPLLAGLAPMPTARLTHAHVDGRVFLFALAVGVLTSLIFGVVPAARAARLDLRRSTRGGTMPAPASMARRVLIGANVALAVVLLAGAGLMIRTVARLLQVDPGFRPDHVLTLHTNLMGVRFNDNDVVLQAQNGALSSLRAVPGVAAAALAGEIPLDGAFDESAFHIEGRMRGRDGVDDPPVERYSVTPGYFDVMGIPLVRGRTIERGDRATSDNVIVINQRAASELFPGRDPIGARVRIGDALSGPWRTIVGIAGDVRHRSVGTAPPLQMYMPQTQFPETQLVAVLRTTGDPSAIADAARRAMQTAVPDAPVERIAPLEALVARSVGPQRFVMLMLALFAAAALALTAVGVYGVISYTVTERTREIGIRTALGASGRQVSTLVLRSGMTVVVIGLALGVAIALEGTEYLRSSLYEVSPRDPLTLVTTAGLLFLVALAAHAGPILRALRVSPTTALRHE